MTAFKLYNVIHCLSEVEKESSKQCMNCTWSKQ